MPAASHVGGHRAVSAAVIEHAGAGVMRPEVLELLKAQVLRGLRIPVGARGGGAVLPQLRVVVVARLIPEGRCRHRFSTRVKLACSLATGPYSAGRIVFGRCFTSRKIFARYMPITPTQKMISPPRNQIETMIVAQPGTPTWPRRLS